MHYDEEVNIEWIAERLHWSVRTTSRKLAPLRRELQLPRNKSFTIGQVKQYFGRLFKEG